MSARKPIEPPVEADKPETATLTAEEIAAEVEARRKALLEDIPTDELQGLLEVKRQAEEATLNAAFLADYEALCRKHKRIQIIVGDIKVEFNQATARGLKLVPAGADDAFLDAFFKQEGN